MDVVVYDVLAEEAEEPSRAIAAAELRAVQVEHALRGEAASVGGSNEDWELQLARDATQQGDRVAAENYFQHADHYYRIVNARNEQQNPRNEQQNNPRNEQQNPRNEQQNARNDKPDSNRRPQNFDNSGSTTDPIPVQPPQPDRGPANLVASPVPSVPQAPVQTIPIQQPSEAITPVPTQAANPTEQLVAELEAQAPKKPRRGRPPKKSAENEDDAPAPEAAE